MAAVADIGRRHRAADDGEGGDCSKDCGEAGNDLQSGFYKEAEVTEVGEVAVERVADVEVKLRLTMMLTETESRLELRVHQVN